MSATSEVHNITERVFNYLVSQIGGLNNNEVEYVLDELITKFEGLQERVAEAAANDQPHQSTGGKVE